MKSVTLHKAAGGVSGTLAFPGDKSLSHRAIIFGALAEGESRFTNVLEGEDCVCTRKAFEALGVQISSSAPSQLTIQGKGLRSFTKPAREIYCGNSGTSMRLLLGVLAACAFETTLAGDASLSSRPMRRVTGPLKQMGASFKGKDEANFAPITVKGGYLKGLHTELPVPSAQVKSAVLLAGLHADGVTTVTEPFKSRDHTENFLSFFGAAVKQDGLSVSIAGGQKLQARSFAIAGDISGAAFFMAAALLVPKSRIQFRSVLWNPTRTGIVEVLKRMGAEFEMESIHKDGPELAADFSLKSRPLTALEIKKEELPSLIDEVPILMLLATQAKGQSVIHDAGELRVKETDRIHSMSTMLGRMGAKIKVRENTVTIDGPTPLRGVHVDSFKDHRTAMSLVIAGLIAEGETTVADIDCINTSFPNFFDLLEKTSVQLSI